TAKNILITGSPGSGKTTLIDKIAGKLPAQRPAGFYTQEIRQGGTRRGFEAISFDNTRMILAHTDIGGSFRLGKYGVDVEGFDRFLEQIDIIGAAGELIVIDEIGKMECFSARFRQLVTKALDSDRVVIATVAEKGGSFIEEVKKRPDISLIQLTSRNRDQLVDDVLRLLSL
ncbi:MAG: NTPase, partial [candidate division Zixibacteria bacterium]|nr:NTPase [candidate division Zixibacteria bacterium]